MTSKEMERKALAQIKKIVESLGEDSYVGTALEGCFEIAEQNIENDWACSMKQRADSYEKKLEELAKIHDHDTYEAGQQLELAQRELKLAKHTLGLERERAEKFLQESIAYGKQCEEKDKEIEDLQNVNDRLMDENKVIKEEYELEIMKLKAKLYDMMTK